MYKDRIKEIKKIKTPENTGVLRHIKNSLSRNRLGESLVLKGHISPSELKSALKKQKNKQMPLGQIFLEEHKITKYQLNKLLMRQKAIRITIATILCLASFSGFSKKTHAMTIKDVPARITLASAGDSSFKNIRSYPNLFGAAEKRSTNLKAFTKWSDMFKRFDNELNQKSSAGVIKKLQATLKGYKSKSIHKMAKQVNTLMNKKRYIADSNNWGKSDYWSTPIEFMKRGGDCEDFAIAKYVALRALGIPEKRMRIAIVQDLKKNIPHAILVVYSEKGPVILDNQSDTMLNANKITHYKPIFSINRTAWWLHTTKKPTIIATAAR